MRDLISAETQTLCWMAIFFFGSAAASSAISRSAKPFRWKSARWQLLSSTPSALPSAASSVPWLFGVLIDTGSRGSVFGGYLLVAGLMIAGGLVAWRCGVAAERKSLEMVARPLTFISEGNMIKGEKAAPVRDCSQLSYAKCGKGREPSKAFELQYRKLLSRLEPASDRQIRRNASQVGEQ
jgi:hypothetical protein